MKRLPWLVCAFALAASVSCLAAEDPGPAPGPVALTVSLPDPGQKLLYVHEVIPVAPGPLTLYYPKWIPGDHSPDGPIGDVMGFEFSANGKRLAWQRDELDRFTFHLDIPADAHQLDIRFEFPSSDRVTTNLIDLTWDHVALYRAGIPTKDQMFQPTLVVPADWQYGSALQTARRDGESIAFKPVPFNTLVDSPVIAGKYFRQIDLTPKGSSVHRYLDMVGDSAAAIAITDRQSAGFHNLIEQAQALFHSHHYDSYHLLLTLSDHTAVGGLEHHQSSDDKARSGSKMFADPAHFMLDGSLLPHEYTHSWNGKFMRPRGLWQPDFEQPEKPKLLWVYEGLTVYLGDTLTVRSGLWSPETWRDVLAYRAAVMAHRTGRAWRPLVDTTIAVDYSAPEAWANWRRQNDFYPEGELLWLAVDMQIRTLSHGKRSIDDFARDFFGVDNGSFVTHTYDFGDLVKALDKVQPYDWATFLHTWVDGTGDAVPLLSGITASGWKLVYTDQPSEYQKALENVGNGELEGRGTNAMFSAGLFISDRGRIEDVLWQGPAFEAGLAPGMQLVSIDDQPYSAKVLWDAIAQARQSHAPLQVRARNDGEIAVYTIHYDGGLKFPHLVREQGKPDYLKALLAPKPVGAGP
ncbi:MAG: PDZ domain family protein [Rhodanobacteraceae bacterium]|jgi:predicted metalloprotease with PDZ domain|nr:MAG: PDZ domain family protein [Rhodanobacteraceae bacterium]